MGLFSLFFVTHLLRCTISCSNEPVFMHEEVNLKTSKLALKQIKRFAKASKKQNAMLALATLREPKDIPASLSPMMAMAQGVSQFKEFQTSMQAIQTQALSSLWGSVPGMSSWDRLSSQAQAVKRPATESNPALIKELNLQEHHYFSDQGSRDYYVFVPSHLNHLNAKPSSRKMIVMLHGCKQNAVDFALGTQMNAIAEQEGFVVLYPEQCKEINALGCWNWFEPKDQKRDIGEPAIIAGITRQCMQEYGISPSEVYIAGLSAGACMALICASNYPDLFSAVAAHSGLPVGAANDAPSALSAMRRGAREDKDDDLKRAISMPMMVIHGDADTVVSAKNAPLILASHQQCKEKTLAEPEHEDIQVDVDAKRTSRSVWKDLSGRTQLEQWIIRGGQHAWSGGDIRGSYTEESGPHASKEIVHFFKKVSLEKL